MELNLTSTSRAVAVAARKEKHENFRDRHRRNQRNKVQSRPEYKKPNHDSQTANASSKPEAVAPVPAKKLAINNTDPRAVTSTKKSVISTGHENSAQEATSRIIEVTSLPRASDAGSDGSVLQPPNDLVNIKKRLLPTKKTDASPLSSSLPSSTTSSSTSKAAVSEPTTQKAKKPRTNQDSFEPKAKALIAPAPVSSIIEVCGANTAIDRMKEADLLLFYSCWILSDFGTETC